MKKTHTLLLISFALMVLCTLLSGCRTGGKWINTGSSGIKSVVSPSNLIKQPNGTYKIEPKKYELPPGNPVPQKPEIKVENIPVPVKSAITKPVMPPVKKAELAELPPVKSPTLPPLSIENKEIKVKMNVKPIGPEDKSGKNNPSPPTHTKGEAPNANQGSESKSTTINWLELFMFYFLSIMALAFVWILYDIWREYKKAKIDKKIKKNLTEPALGKTTKKKAPRKTIKKPKKPKRAKKRAS